MSVHYDGDGVVTMPPIGSNHGVQFFKNSNGDISVQIYDDDYAKSNRIMSVHISAKDWARVKGILDL